MSLTFEDIKKSFTFALKDKDFTLNIVIGGILYSIAACFQQSTNLINDKIIKSNPEVLIVVSIFVLLCIILNIFISGYPLKCANNYLNKKTPVMPSWSNISGIMLTGLKATAIGIIYYIPMILFIAISAMSVFISKQWSLLILLIPLNLVVVAVSIFFQFTAIIVFLKKLSFIDAFDFELISKILSQYIVEIFLLMLTMFGVSFVIGFASTLLCLTCIGIILIPFLTFYSQLILINLMAQFYEKITSSQKETA